MALILRTRCGSTQLLDLQHAYCPYKSEIINLQIGAGFIENWVNDAFVPSLLVQFGSDAFVLLYFSYFNGI